MLALRAISRRVPHPIFTRSASLPASVLVEDLLQDYSKDTLDNTNPLGPRVDDGPPTAGPGGYTSASQNPMSQDNVKLQQLKVSGKHYRFDCHSTRNNTITTLSSLEYSLNQYEPPKSKVIAWFSGGSVGFKKAQRASYEAGYQCAIRVFKFLQDLEKDNTGKVQVQLFFRGFGQGREALKAALMMSEGEKVRTMITSVTDRTALKIGGTRSKKRRRL